MKCLVVLKNVLAVSEAEKELIDVVEKYYDVEVADNSVMLENQKGYSGSRYSVIITSGGDGTVLKTLSICTRKLASLQSAKYTDHISKNGWPMWVDKIERDGSFVRADTILPIVFAFDCGVRGRLCPIKKHLFKKGQSLLVDLLNSMKQDNFEVVDNFYTNNTIRRSRFIVNKSVHVSNEIYVYSREKGFLSVLDISVNSQTVYKNIRCDGLIISTGTGSSGYNASAGGPILHNNVDAVVITAVSAADKKVSPIVISLHDSEVRIQNSFEGQSLFAVIDGCLQVEETAFAIAKSDYGAIYFADVTSSKIHNDFLCAIQE
ncbi:NAD+ kinase [Nematocida minor]|uniref:NAD+ kinase n=1 Tax=Nematocida minor TaxID=1912983 RepID=UPI00221E50B4|nr:NAD+ kinase [Nematocida minor]KAI5192255.1 NAD+ kinase [Nematocida minor]